ncbi:MAG: 4Fe-4S dicluster domain-containing protein [gamma proteobacterium symbiont of Bathyaustriella thionipta]|nr:4Fe-4S dicluster domain-containing protein [gamma proteobacterium symbiont of Bathyaustriella thionipta]MCU7950897.1 4Fe-4S dicluster domain-containing protein [gamma proteobacterium symbiont of Bathyaustriella thionipta]MCU7951801.1 4Fe-4S dicluster domain-containing protein [gamma proteobacterium symbiont of Bathyaustriella thionipta]MCU7957389.1 4Fe-4S dicluster domain-containing protein [gamma proteobacterium symbiont of Bathyaustriella thionipta]MCU7966282.1 4Fe-4S dicluster domain-cont
MDSVFSDGVKDMHYLQRREQTRIIAFNCLTPCDDHCFCEAAHSLDFEAGADIFITPLFIHTEAEHQYLVELFTIDGEQLTHTLIADPCDNPIELKKQAKSLRPEPFGRQFITSLEQLSETIHSQDANDIYEHYAQRCFSCGTCNLVCPTCYCFETQDDFSLDGNSGEKTRHWDACMNPGFAQVASGHNFRAESAARQRHRVRRKFAYLSQRFSEDSFCTGCGRCGRQCTTGIDIFDIVNDVCQSINTVHQEQAQPEAEK